VGVLGGGESVIAGGGNGHYFPLGKDDSLRRGDRFFGGGEGFSCTIRKGKFLDSYHCVRRL